MCGYVVTYEIDSKSTYAFVSHTCIKNCCNIDNIFENNIKNYGSLLEGLFHQEVDTFDLIVEGKFSKYTIIFGCSNC